MLVIDEYLAVRVLVGARPAELDEDEPLALPAYRHHRLLQRIHRPGTGQLSAVLADSDQQAIRRPHPEVFQILDPARCSTKLPQYPVCQGEVRHLRYPMI